jgi:hypothetical protein
MRNFDPKAPSMWNTGNQAEAIPKSSILAQRNRFGTLAKDTKHILSVVFVSCWL